MKPKPLYPMLPITPGGLVWAPADLVIREKIGSLYIVNNGDRHILLYSGCSWALEDRCRSTLGAIVVGEGGDDLEDLSCIASQASREGLEEIIIWIRGEPRHKIESIAKWVVARAHNEPGFPLNTHSFFVGSLGAS